MRGPSERSTTESPQARAGTDPASSRPAWAELLIALSPLTLILLAYAVAQWINAPVAAEPREGATNRLGFGLDVLGPPAADERVLGVVPTVWLQDRLVDGTPHWYDALAALVYVSHFPVLPVVTALVWFRYRDRARSWFAAVLSLTVLGFIGYVAHPAAPPWLASQQGVIGPVDRVSALGWEALHLDVVATLVVDSQGGSNPVAAIPSLHAATPVLTLLFLWPVLRPWWRVPLVVYVAAMAFALVWTGEHYVVDVVAGWATAVVAALVGRVVRRAGGPGRPAARPGRRTAGGRTASTRSEEVGA